MNFIKTTSTHAIEKSEIYDIYTLIGSMIKTVSSNDEVKSKSSCHQNLNQ